MIVGEGLAPSRTGARKGLPYIIHPGGLKPAPTTNLVGGTPKLVLGVRFTHRNRTADERR